MANLARIKANVAKMAAQNAPIADIDGYIAAEGVTVDDVRNFKMPSAAPAQPQAPSGLYNNATAGLNDVIYRTLGAPVDLANTALRAGAAGVHALGGPDIELPVDTVGGHQSIADMFSKVGTNDPSKVVASGPLDQIARAAGEGAGYAIAPDMALTGLSRAGAIAPNLAELLRPMTGGADSLPQLAGNAFTGATAGVGSQVAQNVAPDNLKPVASIAGGLAGGLAGSMAASVPGMVHAGAGVARDFAQPFSTEGQQQMAGQQLRAAATDPQAAMDALASRQPGLPGDMPTTFQASGDMGIGGLERGVAARNPAEFMQRRADQNSARLDALASIQQQGAPEKAAAAVRQRLAGIQQQADASIKAAVGNANQAVTNLVPRVAPENVGSQLRQDVEAARAAAKQQETQLWDAVDPDGTFALNVGGAQQRLQAIRKGMTPMAKPPSGEEAAIYSAFGKAKGSVLPLRQVIDLQTRLKDAMRQERINSGDSAAYRRMSMLNGSIERDLDNAIVSRVRQEQQAVAAGQMAPEETIAASINNWVSNWRTRQSEQAAGFDSGTSGGGNASGRASSSTRVSGATGEGGFRPGGPPGNPGLSADALQPNTDQDAVQRLRDARAATLNRVNTFDNSTLGPISARPSTVSPYDMPAGTVPGQVFFSGPGSPEAIARLRSAVGDNRALQSVEQYANDRLQLAAMRPDGTLDPNKAAAWMRGHADALRVMPGIASRMLAAVRSSLNADQAAKTGAQSVADASEGIAGRLAGVTEPNDVSRIVGGIFSRQDAAGQMMKARAAIGNDPEALDGLKRAVVDHIASQFVGNTEAGTSGLGTMKSDAFQTFLTRNKGALKAAGFNDSQIASMKMIADSLQRANRSIASVRLPGGSNTTQDILASKAIDGAPTMMAKIAVAVTLATHTAGIAGGIATGIAGALQRHGIEQVDDLVKQAMLDPNLALELMRRVKPGDEVKLAGTIGERFLQSLDRTAQRATRGAAAATEGIITVRGRDGSTARVPAMAGAR
jgi:hypothetical protein